LHILCTKDTGSRGLRVRKKITFRVVRWACVRSGRASHGFLQHWVSSLMEVKRGLLAGLRRSAISFLISSSISPPSASEASSSAPWLIAPDGYNLAAYYRESICPHAGNQSRLRCKLTSPNRSRRSATDLASLFMAQVAHMPASPG